MSSALQKTFTIERFEEGAIDPACFDHEAHVYVAWLYLQTHEHTLAIRRFDAALRRLTEKFGAAARYDAMITWLFLKLIAERSRDGEDRPAFCTRNGDLFNEFPRHRVA